MPSEVASPPPALAGYPIVGGESPLCINGADQPTVWINVICAVPLGFLPETTPLSPATPIRSTGPNQPFGLSFVGTAFSEFDLISYAYAYEQATLIRLKVRAYLAAIPKTQLADVVGKKDQIMCQDSSGFSDQRPVGFH